MKFVEVDSIAGRLELALSNVDHAVAVRELAALHARNLEKFAGRVTFAGREAWMKASPLAGRARLRRAALRVFARAPAPRVREALNLEWLEAHGFQVPHPLAAGTLGTAAASWQFLLCDFVAGTPLDVALRSSAADAREPWLSELARETARMHSLHFVHRDLFWRNVLVADAPAARRLVFIDAWRGGRRLQWRKPAYDLACLFLEAPSFLSEAELRNWLGLYAHERRAQGEPIAAETLFAAANAARRALLARVRREPGRWRVPEAPVQEFDFVAAAR